MKIYDKASDEILFNWKCRKPVENQKVKLSVIWHLFSLFSFHFSQISENSKVYTLIISNEISNDYVLSLHESISF